ncbi:MAG: hypothetical protein AB7K52_12350 [Phycisphaerales bacterium]
MRSIFKNLFSSSASPGKRTSGVTRPSTMFGTRPVAPGPIDEPVEDPLLGDPVAHAVKRELERGSSSEAASLLASTTNAEDRSFYVDVLSDTDSAEWVSDWLKRESNSPNAALLAGALGIHQAWRIRGSGYAKTVRDDAWEKFFDCLEKAEMMLKLAAAGAPGDAAPWLPLMQASVGLQHGQAETARRFGELAKRSPHHRMGHSRMLQQFCKKWGGSHEKMFEFARSSSDLAPAGSQVHVLIPEAHIEWWNDDEHCPGQKVTRPDAYFSRRDVREELSAAAERCFDTSGGAMPLDSVRSHNYFAMTLWLAGDHERARHHLKATGNWVTKFPWCFFGGMKAFNVARRECGLVEAQKAAA